MSIPENIGLNHIQSSFFSLLDKIWPHLKQQQKNLKFSNPNKQTNKKTSFFSQRLKLETTQLIKTQNKNNPETHLMKIPQEYFWGNE